MFSLIPENIEAYCEACATETDDLLYRLWRETHLKAKNARMISGQQQGMFLTFIAAMIQPKRTLEIGTFTGYSALCFARGMAVESHIDTIEIDVELEDLIGKYFSQSPYKPTIKLHIGDALQIVPQLEYGYDLAFIDGDKEEYEAYYEKTFPKIKQGGFILVDNVLWNLKVVAPMARQDKKTQAIIDFNEKIKSDARVRNMILPMRDGLMLIEKL